MAHRATERRQRNEVARSRLLDAARQLFMRQGYAVTTMAQVVQRARTSIGNCYFHFPNKEALLRGIVEDFAQRIAREIDAATAIAPGGPAQLAIALARGVEIVLEQKELARVLLVETRQPELRSLVLEYFAARLTDLLDEAGVTNLSAERRWIVLAYEGSIFQLLEAVVTGELQEDARTLARFLIRWNLQALGLTPEAVGQGLAALDTTSGAEDTGDAWPAT
ncbi:MAG TPA: TetR/AcrR family transcriptional regulator [Deltaproteobacteria bacterium]|jgi:AcrR family transcriptional regulator|nr:TetR/AcrR family transcriptional regulator [Deltaproteobacteria bacterium]